jgi:hypothetical protein
MADAATPSTGETTPQRVVTATNKAKAWKSRGYLTAKDVKQFVSQKTAKGKNPNVGAFLERQLAEGYGIASGAVNKFNRGEYKSRNSLLGNIPFGVPTPNIGGMITRGLQMQPGQVYMGAARVGKAPKGNPAAYGLPIGAAATGVDYARMLRTKAEVKALRTPAAPATTTPAQ